MVITSPTNLYSQSEFKSMDSALSFHIGLGTRIHARQQLPVSDDERARLLQTLRRWEDAAKALDEADEAEEFQGVGMRCRECLLALVRESALDQVAPSDGAPPKRADFTAWSRIIANGVFSGPSCERLRRYAKTVAKATWELVNWLTHTTNATRYDAWIGLEATSNVIGLFISGVRRWERGAPDRCPECGSYRVVADFRKELFEGGLT